MREIKFRAWVKTKNIMREVLGSHYNKKNYWLRHGENNNIIELREDIILMQYAGIKDIAGREVYEGDIVEYFNNSIGIVKDITGCFVIDGEFGYDYLCELGGRVKVIGNVFEDKNLIKEV